jgi:hypothetical protein
MTSYRDYSQGNLTDILPETNVTADFQTDQVSGNVTCNNYSGTYQTTGSKITMGPLATTLRECVVAKDIMQQEAVFSVPWRPQCNTSWAAKQGVRYEFRNPVFGDAWLSPRGGKWRMDNREYQAET